MKKFMVVLGIVFVAFSFVFFGTSTNAYADEVTSEENYDFDAELVTRLNNYIDDCYELDGELDDFEIVDAYTVSSLGDSFTIVCAKATSVDGETAYLPGLYMNPYDVSIALAFMGY